MKKVKLPRKRKKAMIKAEGKHKYIVATIVGCLLCKEREPEWQRFYRKYPREIDIHGSKCTVVSWW